MDPIALRVAARFAAEASPPELEALRFILKADAKGEPLELRPSSKHLHGCKLLEKKKLVTIDEGERSFLVTLTDKGYVYVKQQGL